MTRRFNKQFWPRHVPDPSLTCSFSSSRPIADHRSRANEPQCVTDFSILPLRVALSLRKSTEILTHPLESRIFFVGISKLALPRDRTGFESGHGISVRCLLLSACRYSSVLVL